jgi:citrate synthase
MEDPIRQALVLCADNELAASAFAVRVVASTGATLDKSIMAGLGALSGPRHAGGEIDQVHHLFKLLQQGRSGRAKLKACMRTSEPIPGFGHPLYPDGDPRAAALLGGLSVGQPERRLLDLVHSETGRHPMLSFALVAFERSAGLPEGAAHSLFTVGRTAGWIAHAGEQKASDRVIRPRAKYVDV